MATDKSPAAELARATLLLGGVAVLGDAAMAVGAALGKVTAADLDRAKNLEDACVMAFLAVGPLLVPAGVGLRRRRRWGRSLTLALGVLGLLTAAAAGLLTAAGVLIHNREADLTLPALFAGYGAVAVFLLWKDPFPPADTSSSAPESTMK